MKVFIASDLRATVSNGRIYLASQHYYIIKRYYEAFGSCTLCSRVLHQDEDDSLIDATDIIDRVIEVKSLGYSFFPGFYKMVKDAVEESELVIGRLHSIIGVHVLNYAEKHGKKCFAEVMGDAWDAFWNHSLRGKLIAPYAFLMTRKVVWNADFASYVTNRFLQRRYPCRDESLAASDVQLLEMSDDVLKKRLEKIKAFDGNSICLMTTGAVDVRYKGQEYVIRAIPDINKAGIRVKYLLAGGGNQDYLKKIAYECGVSDQVEFLGRLSLNEVYACLDMADIYIQPSLQEGLPRSAVEAMSRGCPVVGAKTAGIPELIPSECVVRRKARRGIAEAIIRIADHEKMMELAKRNFKKAEDYRSSVLNARRDAYFERILSQVDGVC